MAEGGHEAPPGGEPGPGGYPTEEELRAAYEQQVKQIRVDQVVLENVVTVLNLGMRRTGLAPGTEDERDPDQVRVAIESVRSQLPLLEQITPGQMRQIRDALSQLQMAFVRIGGQPATADEAGRGEGGAGPTEGGEGPTEGRAAGTDSPGPAESEPPPKPGEPGPAQRSGRLWVPGQ